MNKEHDNTKYINGIPSWCFSEEFVENFETEETVHQLIFITVKEFCEGGPIGSWVKQSECKCMETDQDGALKSD